MFLFESTVNLYLRHFCLIRYSRFNNGEMNDERICTVILENVELRKQIGYESADEDVLNITVAL